MGVEVTTVLQALIVSAMGLGTVFLTLISLAVAVVIVSKVLAGTGIGQEEDKKPQAVVSKPAAEVKSSDENGELYAAIVAAISEEMKLPVDKFQIVSITEIS